MAAAKGASGGSLWLAQDPSKRWTEIFFLVYSFFWIIWALCILVPFQLYEALDGTGYTLVGLAAALPCVVLPLLLPNKADAGKPLLGRYWVKATVWIAVFSYIGNYFWTHYFFKLLGAAYTMPSPKLNDVPVVMYLMTHAYFCFYHAVSNLLLRRVSNACRGASPAARRAALALVVFLLSYATAFMETLTISHYPYYTFVDRGSMYTTGSLFYAIYFFVSFPMFFRMDEAPGARKWTVSQAFFDSLAAGMLVTIILDLWRICAGGIVPNNVRGLAWAP